MAKPIEITMCLTVAFVSVTISATLIWMVTGLIVLAGRGSSAATRHHMWGLSTLVVLTAPFVAAFVPLPRWIEWNAARVPEINAAQSDQTDSAGLPSTTPTRRVADLNMERPASESISETAQALPTSNTAARKTVDVSDAGTIHQNSGRQWLLLASLFWGLGIVASVIHFMHSSWKCARWIRGAMPVTADRDVDENARLCGLLGIRHRVPMVVSTDATVPFVTGWRSPVIVLPVGYATWSRDRLRIVIAHELAHIQRADLIWQFISRLCLALTWYHPLAWFASSRLQLEREHACDDAVLLIGERPSDYATHLIEIAAQLLQRPRQFASATAMASRGQVEIRVRRILNPLLARGTNHLANAVSAITLLMAVAVAVSISPSFGQLPSTAPDSKTSVPKSQSGKKTPDEPSQVGVTSTGSESLQPQNDQPNKPQPDHVAGAVPPRAETGPPPSNNAAKTVPPKLTLQETIDRLKADKNVEAALFLEVQAKLANQRRAILFGKLVVPSSENPQLCDAQTAIHPSGWFLADVGDTQLPVEFRLWGYRPEQVIHGGQVGEIVNVGEVVLKPFLFEELATVRAEFLFEGKVDPEKATIRVVMEHPKANSATGGTDGFIARPDKENIALGADLRIQKTGMTPIPHYFSVQAPGHLPFRREFKLEPGQTTDVGVLRIAASPKFDLELATSDKPDFTTSEQTVQSVFAGDRFKTNAAGSDWVKAGELSIREHLEKKRTYNFHCALGGLVVTDLGEGTLKDHLNPVVPEKVKVSPRFPTLPLKDGHVYLISHQSPQWSHWTLLRLKMPQEATSTDMGADQPPK